MKLDQTESGV